MRNVKIGDQLFQFDGRGEDAMTIRAGEVLNALNGSVVASIRFVQFDPVPGAGGEARLPTETDESAVLGAAQRRHDHHVTHIELFRSGDGTRICTNRFNAVNFAASVTSDNGNEFVAMDTELE